MATEPIFSSQGIFDDVRVEERPFQSVTGIDTTLADVPGKTFQRQKTLFDASTKRQQQAQDVKSARFKSDITSGLTTGLALGAQDTGETELTSIDSLIKILGGAGLGALTAGPVGAVAGGLAAGLSSFLGIRSNKRRAKAQKAKDERYQKAVREQIRREDAFRKQERLDGLDVLGHDRRRNKMMDQWTLFKDFNSQITDVINQNDSLKKRFAKEGF